MKNLDWGKLSFGYSKTDYNVRCYYKDGKWSAPEVSDSEMLNIHMASTCLHYGQEAFEGMKAFRGKDGKIRLFRCEENAKRMLSSAEYVMMQANIAHMMQGPNKFRHSLNAIEHLYNNLQKSLIDFIMSVLDVCQQVGHMFLCEVKQEGCNGIVAVCVLEISN